MKFLDGWYWPDSERHMVEWISNSKNRVIMNGRPAYQGKKQVAALALCTNFRTALDIGAHIGTWTYNLAASFACVRSFEPVQLHRDCFAANVVAQNVILYPIALGNEDGLVTMHTGPSSTGDTWVDPDARGGTVQMVRLDSFGFTDIDFIKIDVEGFEENILRGGQDTIERCRPVVCVEQKRDMPVKFGLRPQGGVAFLTGLGYRIDREIGGDYLCVPG